MENRYEESNKITKISILLNIILAIFKVGAGIIGNSTAMIADGIHSASDVITSIGILIGNFISNKPYDEQHNYGHERAETLVAFLLSIVLLCVGLEIGYTTIKLLSNPSEIQTPSILPLIAALISIGIKEYQYRITIKIANKINSPALKADAWHHRSDSFSSIGALVGICGSMLGFKLLDPMAGFIVSIVIIKVAIDILKTSSNELLDCSIEKKKEIEIREIVRSIDGVSNITVFKSRMHGAMAYIDLCICVNPDITVKEGHDIANSVEVHIKDKFNGIKGVVVHIDPCGVKGCNCKK